MFVSSQFKKGLGQKWLGFSRNYEAESSTSLHLDNPPFPPPFWNCNQRNIAGTKLVLKLLIAAVKVGTKLLIGCYYAKQYVHIENPRLQKGLSPFRGATVKARVGGYDVDNYETTTFSTKTIIGYFMCPSILMKYKFIELTIFTQLTTLCHS